MDSFKNAGGWTPLRHFLLATLLLSATARAADTDPDTVWPLCGRISESPPPGWTAADGCPPGRAGDPAYADEPLSATFGPRPLASNNNHYDFHRGVDIATSIGTPFFAITDGVVEIAGNDPGYSDPLVKLRHFRPGETSCTAGGCYHSYYLHISGWVVAENDTVVKGQLLGYTGQSDSGFDHLHFEVRDAPDWDVFSAWQRDAIHPLGVVPYSVPNNTAINFNNVDFSDPQAGIVDLSVASNRFDLVRVDLVLRDAAQQVIAQAGNTPDALGYYVAPAFWDMQAWNFQYTHKDSAAIPWSSFGVGGAYECPYHADHGASYDAGVHMDRQDPLNPFEGLFNGVHVRTAKYWPSDVDDYAVDLEFLALEGPAACVQATATFASGDTGYAEWGACSGAANQSPSAAYTWSCQGFSCDFDGTPSSDPDGTVNGWAWDFGDGNTASGAAPAHVFPAAGSYTVQLTATDNDGASDIVSETVSVTEPALVRGPYLQMQTESSIIVRWRTDLPSDSVVYYGTAAGSLGNVVSVPGSRTEHEVPLTGLASAQRYFYSVGDSVAAIAGGPDHYFETAPVPGAAADTRVWVLGDSGTANADARAVREAYRAWAGSDPADLLLMLGDNAYNSGTDAEYQAAVFDTYPAILRTTPLFSTLGNHDGQTADSGSQSGPYYDIHNFPTAGEIGGLASGTEAYYSFDYANIHFISLDSYDTDRSPSGAMLTWLENDLALNTQPWVIAFWHHPPYSKGSHDSDTEGLLIDMRQNALPVLEAWGVDLVLSGHSHSYERSYLLDGHYGHSLTLDPVENVLDPGDGSETGDGMYQKPDQVAAFHEGAVYAVAGSSGKKSAAPLDHPAMYVSLYTLGSLVLDIAGNRLDATFLDETGSVLDEFSIVKTPDIEPPLLTGAAAVDATHVQVDFDEALDPLEAENAANYAIAGLAVSAAALVSGDRSVLLTTSAMTPDAGYTVVVYNVQDLALNTIQPNSQAGFTFFELMTASFQDALEPSPAYDGTFDAYIREASPDTGYGLAASLQVDGSEPSGSETDMNILLGWDIGSIPVDAVVTDAFMTLEVTNASNGTYQCQALLRAWNQAQVTWNAADAGSPWGAPGASAASDRGTDVLCTVAAGSTGTLTVNFTPEGLARVQSWVSDPSSNHGLVIADAATSDGADFHSSESATAMSRPKLNVTYRVPAGNSDPVASFAHSCTDLDCSFSDSSTDGDGVVAGWYWDFGDGGTSTQQNPSHTYASAGDYTVSLTATDNDGASDLFSDTVTVTSPGGPTDQVAEAEIAGSGAATGIYTDTHSDDGVSQSITERESGGRKSDRHSYLEWTWRFQVVPGSSMTLFANAWFSGSGDGDQFVFAWSSDGVSFTDLFVVSSTDPANLQSAPIPAYGTVYIRVRDTDQAPGNRGLDTVFVDHLFVRSEAGEPPPPPPAVITLTASGSFKGKGQQVKLEWGGATSTSMDVFRDGVIIATTSNNGRYTDNTGNSGPATYVYKVCEAGTDSCSNEATVVF